MPGGRGKMETHAESGLEHAGRDDQVGQDESGHAEGEEDRFAGVWRPCACVSRSATSPRAGELLGSWARRTWVEGRVDDLLGLPELWRHRRDLSLLVVAEEGLGLLETGAADEQGAVDRDMLALGL